MIVVFVFAGIFVVFWSLCIWDGVRKARKKNIRLGIWGALTAGLKNLFARIADTLAMGGW